MASVVGAPKVLKGIEHSLTPFIAFERVEPECTLASFMSGCERAPISVTGAVYCRMLAL